MEEPNTRMPLLNVFFTRCALQVTGLSTVTHPPDVALQIQHMYCQEQLVGYAPV